LEETMPKSRSGESKTSKIRIYNFDNASHQ